jgi:ribonuclease J
VTINEETGALEATPEIVARGVLGIDGSNGFVKDIQRVVAEAVEKATSAELGDASLLKERVRLEAKRFVQKQTGARPVITPIIVQI